MSDSGERGLVLLRKSQSDLHAAMLLSKDSESSICTIGFHAQQAVEKALKAVLMARRVRYPFTHDITTLLKLLSQSGI